MIIVLITDAPNRYIVGEMEGELQDVEGSRVWLSGCVRMSITPNPEDPGSQRLHINPIITCETMCIDLQSYLGVGPLKSDLREKYTAWRSSYESHEEVFGDKK